MPQDGYKTIVIPQKLHDWLQSKKQYDGESDAKIIARLTKAKI